MDASTRLAAPTGSASSGQQALECGCPPHALSRPLPGRPFTMPATWRIVSPVNASRLGVVPVVVLAVLSGAGSAAADPPPTQQITTVAVGSKGQAVNGFHETPPAGNVAIVDDCSTPS